MWCTQKVPLYSAQVLLICSVYCRFQLRPNHRTAAYSHFRTEDHPKSCQYNKTFRNVSTLCIIMTHLNLPAHSLYPLGVWVYAAYTQILIIIFILQVDRAQTAESVTEAVRTGSWLAITVARNLCHCCTEFLSWKDVTHIIACTYTRLIFILLYTNTHTCISSVNLKHASSKHVIVLLHK